MNDQISITRRLPASAAEVFNEWIDPDALVDWMCPRPARLGRVEVDLVEGGTYRFVIVDGEKEMTVSGRYLVLDPPHRLSFTWSCDTWDDPTVESVVTVTLADHGDECDITITHERLPTNQIPNHRLGWEVILIQIQAHLTSSECRD